MTLKDFREAYYTLSGKASDITRQLGFAGLGAIWIFKYGSAGSERVPNELVPAAVAIVLALLLDFLQYAVGSLVWGAFARYKERKGVGDADTVVAPLWFNWPALLFFWAKLPIMCYAYYILLTYLAGKVV